MSGTMSINVIGQSWRVGRACPQRAGLRLTVCGGALRTGAPYLPLSLRHYTLDLIRFDNLLDLQHCILVKPKSVRLFIKPYCGWCHKAMRWLDEHGVDYETI